MGMQISIQREGRSVASGQGDRKVELAFKEEYAEGDVISFSCDDKNVFLVVQFEDTVPASLVYYTGGEYQLPVPFGDKRVGYSPKSFTGKLHLLAARYATDKEVAARRNLALNPFDHHQNECLYPHSVANVETRGEASFASRNAINGNYANADHGYWPYESWGINSQDDAALTLDFGRKVKLDEVGITIRADFPHDNYWQKVDVIFDDAESLTLELDKVDTTQLFELPNKVVEKVTFTHLIKDPNDPSPFPALTQIEFWGTEA